jgi:hypothetical protein
VQAPEYVNLFYGMPMKPDPEKSCAEILELLLYLCGDEDPYSSGCSSGSRIRCSIQAPRCRPPS